MHASSTSLHENFEMYTYSLLVGLNFPLCCTMLKFVILTTLHMINFIITYLVCIEISEIVLCAMRVDREYLEW